MGDHICGWDYVPHGNSIYVVTTPDGPFVFIGTLNPDHDVFVSGPHPGPTEGGPGGYIVVGFAGGDINVGWFHNSGYSGSEPPNALFRTDSFSIHFDDGGPTPTYLTGAPTLIATPGDGEVQLNWTAAPSCDSIVIVGYDVTRDGVQIATDITDLSLLDTGRSNGTTYTYQVRAKARILGYNTHFGVIDSQLSSEVDATPSSTSTITVAPLCYTSLPIGCTVTFLAEGLAPGHAFTWRINGSPFSAGTADANGHARIAFTNAVAGTDNVTLTDGTGTIAGPSPITWTSPAGACPAYLSGTPVLTGFSNPLSSDLVWTAVTTCDPRLIIHYEVLRRPHGVGGYTKIADLITDLAYSDTDVEACDDFDYKVTAVASLYVASDSGTFGSSTSNVVELSQPCGTAVFDGVRFRVGDDHVESPPEGGTVGFDEVRFRASGAEGGAAVEGVDFDRVRWRQA